jgi:predicted RNase H-like HicB family nuclease
MAIDASGGGDVGEGAIAPTSIRACRICSRYCSAHGETPHEAAAEVEVAVGLWLEVAREEGMPIPEPIYRPDKRTERIDKEAAACTRRATSSFS